MKKQNEQKEKQDLGKNKTFMPLPQKTEISAGKPAPGNFPAGEFSANLPALTATVRKWCFGVDVPIFLFGGISTGGVLDTRLNSGDVVTVKRQHQFPGDENWWSEIVFSPHVPGEHQGKVMIVGWVNDMYLDPYYQRFPSNGFDNTVEIANPTPDPTDAQQFLTLPGQIGFEQAVRFNMCGELCVAFIVQGSIEAILKNWEMKSRAHYESILGKGQSNLTGPDDLIGMLRANLQEYGFGNDDDQIIKYFDPMKPTFKPGSPEKMMTGLEELSESHQLIMLVKIDKKSGVLIHKKRPGTDHWVVLDRINGNKVELYNPFQNQREEYSSSELFDSNGFAGVWVKRKPAPQNAAGEAAIPFHVELDSPKPAMLLAEQYIAREGGIKHNLCGPFSVAYILGNSIEGALAYWREAPPQKYREFVAILKAYGYDRKTGMGDAFTIGTVLDYWKEVQPELYQHFVVGDKPTGAQDLATILRAYGYNTRGDYSDFRSGLTFSGQYLPSPGNIKKMLKTHFLIAGVGIDGISGRLIDDENAARHWVVLESIDPNGRHYTDPGGRRPPLHAGGNGGWVTLYNPFTNVIEEYSYMEFTNSMSPNGGWYGMWVKRGIAPVFVPQELVHPLVEVPPGKGERKQKNDGPVKRWPDSKMVETVQKKLRNDKTREQILADLVRETTGWSQNEIARLIPSEKKVEAVDNLESSLAARLKINAIQPEIMGWLETVANKELEFAINLINTMKESGLLEVVEQAENRKQIIFKETPPGMLVTAQKNQAENPGAAFLQTRQVANLIVPLLAQRASREILAIRSKQIG